MIDEVEDYRKWKWNPCAAVCSRYECRDNGTNGHWTGPRGSLDQRVLCWDHYKEALAYQAAQASLEVRDERKRIAAALEAWVALWKKPHRIAFTAKTVESDEMVSLDWLSTFAEEIRNGTFGKPHSSKPDPLYET